MPRGTPSISTLKSHGTTLLRDYVEADTRRTSVLRELAKVIVGIRSQTFQKDGKTPDWSGQSQAYRDTISAMYEDAGIPKDRESNVQSALRYHIGEVLREVVSSKALTAAGLATKGPKDRARTRAAEAQENGHQAEPTPIRPTPPATDPEACIREAITMVQTAGIMPTPEDPSTLVILCITLEHACQTLREILQPAAEEVLLRTA